MNRKKQKLSAGVRNTKRNLDELITVLEEEVAKGAQQNCKNTKRDLDEHITALEKEVADKGAQLNFNGVFREKEKKEIRKLKPEFETLGEQLKLETHQLLMEKIHLEMLLREKEKLYNKAVDYEKRLINAKEKFDKFSNEIYKKSTITVRNINSFPDEILFKIFSYLRQNEFNEIARVCKRWYALTKNPVLWKIVDVDLYECRTEAVQKFVQTLPSCVSFIKIEFKDYLWREEDFDDEKLDFKEICITLKEKCPHLQALKMYHAELFDGLSSVIDLCAQYLQGVRRLGFYNSNFVDFHYRKGYSGVSKIEVLDVVACQLRDFDILTLSKMCCLRALNLRCTEYHQLFFRDDTMDFLNELKVLNVGFTGISFLNSSKATLNQIVNLEELYLCDININDSDLDLSNLALPHLKTICLRTCWEVDCEDVISLIRSCQSLENVYVDDDVAKAYAKDPFVVINRCKLEVVKANNFCDCHQTID